MKQGGTQAEGVTLNGIVTLLNAVAGLTAGLAASQQSQRNEIEAQRSQIDALIEELRGSRAPSTTPHLEDMEPPQNLPPLPEFPLTAGSSRMEQGRTQTEGTMSKSIDTSTTTVGLATSQQSQRCEIEAEKGQINAPIDELRRPRALRTTPKSTPNRNYDLHEVEDIITPPSGPEFYTVKDTAGTFTQSVSLLRVQALQCRSCSTPSDENITPINIPLQISAQGGVQSENTAPKARAASLLPQSNSKPTPKIVATQKRLLLDLNGTKDVEITFPKRSGRLPDPMAYTDTDWGGSLTCYAFKIAGGPISWCSHRTIHQGYHRKGYHQHWY
jgi:hypothetical protein